MRKKLSRIVAVFAIIVIIVGLIPQSAIYANEAIRFDGLYSTKEGYDSVSNEEKKLDEKDNSEESLTEITEDNSDESVKENIEENEEINEDLDTNEDENSKDDSEENEDDDRTEIMEDLFKAIEIEEKEEPLENQNDYILNNINLNFARALKCEAVDAITVKQTFADIDLMPKDNLTIDGLWRNDYDKDLGEFFGQAFITMNQSATILYNTDDESEYFVAFINPMISDGNISTTDVVFAKNNYNGETYSDCIYDSTTGLAYVPKKYTYYMSEEEKEYALNVARENGLEIDSIDETKINVKFQSQVQLLQLVKSKNETTTIDIEIESNDTPVDDARGEGKCSIIDGITTISLTDDIQKLSGISKDDISVYVDDIDIAWENFTFDKDSGTVILPVAPSSLNSIRIEIRGEVWYRKLFNSLFKGTEVHAESIPNSLLDYRYPWVFEYVGNINDLVGKKILIDNATDNDNNTFTMFNNWTGNNVGAGTIIDRPIGNVGKDDIYEEGFRRQTIAYVTLSFDGKNLDDTNGLNNLLIQYINASGNLAGHTFNELAPALNNNSAIYGLGFPTNFTASVDGTTVDFTVKKSDDYGSHPLNPESLPQAIEKVTTNYNTNELVMGLYCTHVASPLGDITDDRTIHNVVLNVLSVDTINGKEYALIGAFAERIKNIPAIQACEQTPYGIMLVELKKGTPPNGFLKISKSSTMPSITNGNARYSFSKIKYGVYNGSSCTSSQLVTAITLDSNGSSPEIELANGKYFVKEIDANTPDTGYKLDTRVYPVNIEGSKETVTLDVEDIPLEYTIPLVLTKKDSEALNGSTQGNGTLQGAEYTVKYYDVDLATDPAKNGKSPTRTWVMRTDDKGKFSFQGSITQVNTYKVSGDDFYINSNDKVTFPLGTVTVQETKAPRGYLINDEVYTIQIKYDVTSSNLVTATYLPTGGIKQVESPVLGGIKIKKYDKELSLPEALGGKDHIDSEHGATLEGIEYGIYNANGKTIRIKDKEFIPDSKIMTIKTKWSDSDNAYVAKTSENALPYGTYLVREIKTNDAYLIDSNTQFTFNIESNKKVVAKDTVGNDIVFSNQVKRRDIEGEKVEDNTLKRMAVAFLATNKKTGERHIIVSDENGELDTSSSWNKHSFMTNYNDRLLSYYEDGKVIPTSEINTKSGVWFGLGENGSISIPNDDLGAFIYGEYSLEELPCESNVGHKLINIDFIINRNSNTRPLDLSTITNDFVEIEKELPTESPKEEEIITEDSSEEEILGIDEPEKNEELNEDLPEIVNDEEPAPIPVKEKETEIENKAPKTGDSFIILIVLAISFIAFFTISILKKKGHLK